MIELQIQLDDDSDFFATREVALPFRVALEARLQANCETVVVDMSTIRNASHSAIDELLGSVVRDNGPRLLERISLRGCNSSLRSLINVVIGDAINEFSKHNA